jgi:hypothetical protein
MTADERVKVTIGHYVVAIAALEAKVEELTQKIAELEKDKPPKEAP